jgi:hypothetical protein
MGVLKLESLGVVLATTYIKENNIGLLRKLQMASDLETILHVAYHYAKLWNKRNMALAVVCVLLNRTVLQRSVIEVPFPGNS